MRTSRDAMVVQVQEQAESSLSEKETDQGELSKHPLNNVDHRVQNGPLLNLLWSEEEPLSGQTLYLGGEVGSDGKIYCIPGHAPRVLVIDPETDKIKLIGPNLTSNGTKFKWLRGVPVGDVIYGLPCHASEVLRIHVPTQTITKIPIPYDEFYGNDPKIVKQQKEMIWKYHGGSVCPMDNCIYAIPQSAWHVLKVDPSTDTCSLVGPKLEGKYKWYGGVVGETDGAIYGVPHNSPSVIRITPTKISLHGDYGPGGHKWHGAAKAGNGVIVCIPNNKHTVLCITPGDPAPTLTEIGDADTIQSGRHRSDGKYKYLGAMMGTNGKVYVFPSASEYVLEVDATNMVAQNIGPNLRDVGLENVHQNKWQNGLTNPHDQCVYGIPLAGETLLQIDCSQEPAQVKTWNLPSPYQGRDKWEGGVITSSGIMYTVPNNCKAVLRIQPCNFKREGFARISEPPTPQEKSSSPPTKQTAPTTTKKDTNHGKKIASEREYGGNKDHLVYKSGIPTLRSSAHRVKFDVKSRKHDPKPRNNQGKETKTTWLPDLLLKEDVFQYDIAKYDLCGAVISMLDDCDPDIVGSFTPPTEGSGSTRLEDFRVPVSSIWRSVNGGRCESAQKYLSDAVAANETFLKLFDKFVEEVTLPYIKQRLLDSKKERNDDDNNADEDTSITFYYQRPPTMRLQPGPGWAKVKPHNDAEYGHQNGELNFWIPLTNRELNGVDLWCETTYKQDDYHPIPAKIGEAISFHGSSCRHYVNANGTEHSRVSLDFRVGVQGYFDPYWQMKGTTDDHGRREITL